MSSPYKPIPTSSGNWPRFRDAVVRGFHAYASWLVSIGWGRFFVLSVLLLIVAAILTELPPFNIKISETIVERPVRSERRSAERPPKPPLPPQTGSQPAAPAASSPPAAASAASQPAAIGDGRITINMGKEGIQISEGKGSQRETTIRIGENGIEVNSPDGRRQESKRHQHEHDEAFPEDEDAEPNQEITITFPKDATREDVKRALEEFEAEIKQDTGIDVSSLRVRHRIETARLGDFLPDLALLIIFASIFIKITYKGRIAAEAVAAAATETAGHEQLKRQVVEARMAAMQAQVEPHFLFNTLASIEHLIETDPPRAARMQRTLIDFLRAAMPTLREANAQAVRDLGRELAVVRPYLDILKMRMEDRLEVNIDVPEGLLSAEFPPLMLQSLVENAIKHGLEPKAEGGTLSLKAQIEHGQLAVSVADTGLGFEAAAANGTAGTGIGLSNIRERLQLIYGDAARLTLEAVESGGTRAVITLPYQARRPDNGSTNA